MNKVIEITLILFFVVFPFTPSERLTTCDTESGRCEVSERDADGRDLGATDVLPSNYD